MNTRSLPLAAIALIGALAVGTAVVSADSLSATPAKPVRAVTATAVAPADFSSVIQRVSPAVVHIQVSEPAPVGMVSGDVPALPKDMDEFFRRFFGDQMPQNTPNRPHSTRRHMTQGIGSGFIIDPAGYIVTNNHVVGDATKITVTLYDHRRFEATLVGTDPETDLSLIRIKGAGKLPYVSFSKGPTPRPGEWVIAIGNPFGLDHTVTAGIVSATGRAIGAGPYDDFIQIDAPINKGNSGGPTFNLAGQVVGVNAAIYSPNGGSVGIGFAIPATIARDVIAKLKAHGSVERGWLGVEVQQVTPDIAEGMGLDHPHGALVSSIVPDGPAAKAGLATGDLIVAVNGKQVDQMRTLPRVVAAISPGAKASLEVLRDGKTKTMTVEIGKRPAQKEMASAEPATGRASGAVLGMRLRRTDEGVAVVDLDPEGTAAQHGIAQGDVIVEVANHAVHSPRDVRRKVAAERKAGRKAVLMLMSRDGTQRFVALPLHNA